MKSTILLMAIGLLSSSVTFADIKMIMQTTDGNLTTWANDNYFRTKLPKNQEADQNPMPPGDMLGVFKMKKIYMIIDEKKLLIDMSAPMPFAAMSGNQKPPKLKIRFKNKGAGNKIAGMVTTKYDIIAQGQKCFEVLTTKNKTYSALIKKYDSIDSPQGDSQNLCDEVENQIDDEMSAKYGYAVKMTDANGKVQMLLKEFKTGIKAPKKYLSLPKGYRVTTMMEAMSEMMSGKLNQ